VFVALAHVGDAVWYGIAILAILPAIVIITMREASSIYGNR